MKKFGFCVSLVTEDLKAVVPLHSVYELSDERREVVDRYMAGLVLGEQETEDESALTLDGLTELSMAKT